MVQTLIRTPEDVWVGRIVAGDEPRLLSFLARPEIDALFVKPLSMRSVSLEARIRRGTIWIEARIGLETVGCRAIIFDPGELSATLSTFAVDPRVQGQGIGSLVYEESLRLARTFHPVKIRTDSWEGNVVAAHLARKYGLQQVDAYLDPARRPLGIRTVVYELALERPDRTR